LAILFALCFRNSDEDKEAAEFLDDDDFDLSPNEEYLHSIKVYSFVISINKFFLFFRKNRLLVVVQKVVLIV